MTALETGEETFGKVCMQRDKITLITLITQINVINPDKEP